MTQRKLTFAKNAAYNTIGALVNSFCLWLTTLVVVRFCDDYANAGIWQLSISITNVFSVVAIYNLSAYFVSDVKDEYRAEEYLNTQLTTCALSFFMCLGYALLCGYRGVQLTCILSYMLCRAVEAYAGLLLGIEQRNYRMDYIGISYSLRGIGDLLAFSAVLKITQSTALAALAMVAVTALVILLYDIPKARQFASLRLTFRGKNVGALLKKCFPGVVSIAAFTAIVTLPRQYLEGMYGEETLGYYATVATPIVVVQVLATGIFNPLLRDMAVYYQNRDIGHLKKIAGKLTLVLLVLATAAFGGAKLIGEFAYTLLYGEPIRPYCYLMYGVVACAVLYAACVACWNMMIAMRKMQAMMVISLLSLALTAALSRPLIIAAYMNGVSYAVLLGYMVYLLFSVIYILRVLRERML